MAVRFPAGLVNKVPFPAKKKEASSHVCRGELPGSPTAVALLTDAGSGVAESVLYVAFPALIAGQLTLRISTEKIR